MKLIVGLGNPGEKYKKTRHNIGFMTVDALAKHYGLSWHENKKLNVEMIECEDTFIIKPLTFMNDSGKAVYAVMNYYKILPKIFGLALSKDSDLSDKLTVIHDDLDIELGQFRVATDSRSAGHRGVESIITHLKTQKFKRYRIGIKVEKEYPIQAEKFVLEKFSEEELGVINNLINTLVPELIK